MITLYWICVIFFASSLLPKKDSEIYEYKYQLVILIKNHTHTLTFKKRFAYTRETFPYVTAKKKHEIFCPCLIKLSVSMIKVNYYKKNTVSDWSKHTLWGSQLFIHVYFILKSNTQSPSILFFTTNPLYCVEM